MIPPRRLHRVGLVLLALAASCGGRETGLVVDVASNLKVPEEIDRVEVRVRDADGTELGRKEYQLGEPPAPALPLRVGIDASRAGSGLLLVEALGVRSPRQVRVWRRASVAIVPGDLLHLSMPLLAQCLGRECPLGQSCTVEETACGPGQPCPGTAVCRDERIARESLARYMRGTTSPPIPVRPDDLMPPTIVSTRPADQSVGAAATTAIRVEFSRPMDPRSVEAAFSLLRPAGHPFTVHRESATAFEVRPTIPFEPGELVRFAIATTATDEAGNRLGATTTASFRVLQFRSDVLPLAKPWGSVTSTGGISTNVLRVGEAAETEGTATRAFLSFALTGIPSDAVVRKAELFVSPECSTSATVALGALEVQHVAFGPSLTGESFDGPALSPPVVVLHGIGTGESTLGKKVDVTAAVRDDLVHRMDRGARAQFRVQFVFGPREDGRIDGCTIRPPSLTFPPQLVVEYEAP